MKLGAYFAFGVRAETLSEHAVTPHDKVCVVLNQKETLTEVNKLVSNGLRKAAIDLMQEYLETDPNSPKVLSTLGRAYLLDRQPEMAVSYLKRSLEISQRMRTAPRDKLGYRANDFDDDDMAYVDSQVGEAPEDTFSFEDGESAGSTAETPIEIPVHDVAQPVVTLKLSSTQEPDSGIPSKSTSHQPGSDDRSPNDAIRLPDKQQQEATDDDLLSRAVENAEVPRDSNTDDLEQPNTSTHHPAPNDDWTRTKAVDSFSTIAGSKADSNDWCKEKKTFCDEDEYTEEYLAEDESLDEFITEEVLNTDDDYANDIEDVVDSDPLLDEFALTINPIILDDEADDLDWGDLEDLDEFDELEHRAFEIEGNDDAVTRDQRARQIAVEVLAETDWKPVYIPLLQQIFIENGWSATRIAIEKAVQEGLIPEELELAREIRLLWAESEQYWIGFYRIKTNAPFCQTDAAYKHMSWQEAIRIVRCFPYVPDIEEIYTLIEESYEQWYKSGRLRCIFKAFFKFLKYRTGSMRRTLPGDFLLSFRETPDANLGLDSDVLLSHLTPESQTLSELGVHLNQWPKPPEYKIKVVESLLNQDSGKSTSKKRLDKTKERVQKRKFKPDNQPSQKASFGFGSSI